MKASISEVGSSILWWLNYDTDRDDVQLNMVFEPRCGPLISQIHKFFTLLDIKSTLDPAGMKFKPLALKSSTMPLYWQLISMPNGVIITASPFYVLYLL